MLGDVVFVGQKRPHAPQLKDALASVQNGQFIHVHECLAQFLIIERVGGLPPTALTCVVGVNRFLPQGGGQLFQRCRLPAAQEDGTVHIADDGIGVVLVDDPHNSPDHYHNTQTD